MFWSVYKYCGSAKYTSYQTFLCIRSVLSLFHYDKRSSWIVLLRLWIEARFVLFILRHIVKAIRLVIFPKKRTPPQQVEQTMTVTKQPPGSMRD